MDLILPREAERARNAVAAAPLQNFGVPHLIVDNIFSEDLVARINENWPGYAEGFMPETAGNHILCMYRKDYGRLADSRLRFWQSFNEILWPTVVSATAKALEAPGYEVFGDLYHEHLSIDMALTLMQADPTYWGHHMHTHFYHAPHWAFTMLLYIDPADIYSRGTALHRLLPRDGSLKGVSSYPRANDLDWRTQVAMETFHWLDPKMPDRVYDEQVAAYKANRLFVFMDGPLALHSVPFDNPDFTPNPKRGDDNGARARRRILRSHIKIDHTPFYAKHSAQLREPLDPTRYMRIMAPNAVLSAEDERHREQVMRPFFRERLDAYARAAQRVEHKIWSHLSRAWERIVGSRRPVDFRSQFASRIP